MNKTAHILSLFSWHSTASWAFGFFAIAVTGAVVAAGVTALIGWWSIPDKFHLDVNSVWCGGWLFVALVIIAGIICSRIF